MRYMYNCKKLSKTLKCHSITVSKLSGYDNSESVIQIKVKGGEL